MPRRTILNLKVIIEAEYKYDFYDDDRELEASMANELKKVFIVHGTDIGAKEFVARRVEKIGLKSIVIAEEIAEGRTIIEQIEYHSDAQFAVVILSPDDLGKKKSDKKLEERARQNVILELGYFIGRLGRNRTFILKKGNVHLPTDIFGIIWHDLDDAGHWSTKLAKELRNIGISVDMNLI